MVMERTSFSVNFIHFQMARKKILQGQKTLRSILSELCDLIQLTDDATQVFQTGCFLRACLHGVGDPGLVG